MSGLVQITSPYYCAGIVVKDDIVTETAPILKWMMGKGVGEVLGWVVRKRFKYEVVEYY